MFFFPLLFECFNDLGHLKIVILSVKLHKVVLNQYFYTFVCVYLCTACATACKYEEFLSLVDTGVYLLNVVRQSVQLFLNAAQTGNLALLKSKLDIFTW